MAKKYDYDLYLFRGECGHEWVGSVCGTFACPVCGLYDGDHHLTLMEPIAVQVEDIGCTWHVLAADSAARCEKQGIE